MVARPDRVPRSAPALGLVIGVAITVAVAAWSVPSSGGPRAAAQFLDLWARHRAGTWIVEGTWQRITPGQAPFAESRRVVQAPPQYLIRQGSTTTGIVGGQAVVCAPGAGGGTPRCLVKPAPGGYDADVAAERRELERAVLGPDPIYEVVVTGRCVELTNHRPDPTGARFGRSAQVCFDAATGAQTRWSIDRGSFREQFVGTVIGTPGPDAFAVPSS